MKLKNRSRKRSHKLDGIGVGRIRTFPFSCYSAYYPVASFRLWSSENQIVGVGSRSWRISQSQCSLKRFVIGLVLPLLLATPTTQFSLDRKRRSGKHNNNAVSLSRIVPHASVYDSVLAKTSLKELVKQWGWYTGALLKLRFLKTANVNCAKVLVL